VSVIPRSTRDLLTNAGTGIVGEFPHIGFVDDRVNPVGQRWTRRPTGRQFGLARSITISLFIPAGQTPYGSRDVVPLITKLYVCPFKSPHRLRIDIGIAIGGFVISVIG